jgi:alpha-mannosidase
VHKPPFQIRGAPNVIIETIKRGDDDKFSALQDKLTRPDTIILRIYEAFGGHARAYLRISGLFAIAKAYQANLLEDNLEELTIFKAEDSDEDVEIKLDFQGFEVKTVKLVLGEFNPQPEDAQS